VGRILRAASARFSQVIGVDVSEEAIARARELLSDCNNVELVKGSGYDLSVIPNASIDFLYSFAALTSVPTEVIAHYLVESRRVLKDRGYLRLQVYLGKPQAVRSDDTLHLRCFEQVRFEQALHCAGFTLESCEELILPFQVSFHEIGIVAYMITARPGPQPVSHVSEVAETLLPEGELNQDSELSGRELECWMALRYAQELATQGDFERARETLNYVYTFQKTITIDIRDTLQAIEDKLGAAETTIIIAENEVFEANRAALQKHFPEVAELLDASTSSTAAEEYETEEGWAISLSGQPLDHLTRPRSAARKWCSSVMQELGNEGELVIFGFGSGYHVDEVLRVTDRQVAVIEPSLEVFQAACRRHDFRELFAKLGSLIIGDQTYEPRGRAIDILMRPQAQTLFPEMATKLRQRVNGTRGLSTLHPQIAVLGPLHGGTLPIAAYTHMALHGCGQRTRDVNVSGFDESYKLVDNFLRDENRRNLMKANFTEAISQMLIEMVTEKPIDILICMPFAPISARALDELRGRGIITALWFVEDFQRFNQWQYLAPHFDFVFTIQEGQAITEMERAGAGHVSYLPCAAEPQVHRPQALTEQERQRYGSQISFLGAGYHNRQQSFASLAGYDFKIWGTEWPGCKPFDTLVQDQGRRLSPAEYTKIFCASDINLNLHSSTERDGVDPTGDFVNPRTFELAACDAFQLVDHRSLLPALLTPGEDIVTFRSIAEMREQIDHFLARPDERLRFAQAARRRVLAEHTYEHRVQEMLQRIYGVRYDQLRRRELDSPWSLLLSRSKKFEELGERCQRAFDRGEQANLDGLVADIMTGQGDLTETEQKLLFLYHVRKQMIRIETSRAGG
jgi:spore maturation protein CgeB